MGTSGTTLCLACEALQREIGDLRAKVADLEGKLAKANKDSSNSSKPPSSDIVKPPRSKRKRKRKIGAQPGHPRHGRPSFEPDQVDKRINYTLPYCPDCGGHVAVSDELPRVVQQIEIVEKPTLVTEHCGLAYWCAHCQKLHYGVIDPAARKAGLFGPRLTALVASLKGLCHASSSTIR